MKKNRKALAFISILALGFFFNYKYDLSKALLSEEGLKNLSVYVRDRHFWAAFFYLVFTILSSSLLALPGVTFAILATALFGPWLGTLYCLIGTTAGASLSFFLSRYLLKDYTMELLAKNQKLYDILYKMSPEKEWTILMITRLLPIFPFNLQNFAYGVSNIGLGKYALGSFIFMIPGTLAFALGTEGVIHQGSREQMFGIAFLVLGLLVITGFYLHKRYQGMMMGEEDGR